MFEDVLPAAQAVMGRSGRTFSRQYLTLTAPILGNESPPIDPVSFSGSGRFTKVVFRSAQNDPGGSPTDSKRHRSS